MNAWVLSSYQQNVQMTFSRNPYYWKVDNQGNQLPYIDQIIFDTQTAQSDHATRLSRLSQGLYDASFRGSSEPTDIPALTAAAVAGGYHLQKGWVAGTGANPGWMINQDYTQTAPAIGGIDTPQDLAIRGLLRNPQFRRALSVAIDRQDFINTVFNGSGTPKAWTVSPQAFHFSTPDGQVAYQNWAKSYAQFDANQANTWLDDLGLATRDGENCRNMVDGQQLRLTLDYSYGNLTDNTAAQRLKVYLKAVGVCITDYNADNYTGNDRVGDSNWMLRTWGVSELDMWSYPDWVFPVRGSRYFPMEGGYRASGGYWGWAPTGDAAALLALWDQAVSEPDPAAREVIFRQAVQYHIDHGPYVLAAAGDQPQPVVVKNNFHNVPEYGILGPWAPTSPGNLNPEQFWISNEDLAPSFARMTPNQGSSDTASDVYVYGDHFFSGISAAFGATDLQAQLISSTILRVTIPAGLAPASYDLTLTNLGTAPLTYPKAYSVLDPANLDLQGYAYEFSAAPAAPRANTSVSLGLTIYQIGGSSTLHNVHVDFYNGNPSAGGVLLGQGTVTNLAPNASASTSLVSWTPTYGTNCNLYAVIDPGNAVTESNETNNWVTRSLVVLPPAIDLTPPVVDSFSVDDGATSVNNLTVTLKATAHDPTPPNPASGVDAILAVEYQYNQASGQWLPGQDTGWVPYASMTSGYTWQLLPSPGVKYFKVWAKDAVGNVSEQPFVAFVNYYPSLVNISQGQSHIYRFNVAIGQTLLVTLTQVTGDPDLYVWKADSTPACHSIGVGSAVDTCAYLVTAGEGGVFQVEVFGYEPSSYVLQVAVNVTGAAPRALQPGSLLAGKTVQTVPAVDVVSVPSKPYTLPPSMTYLNCFLPVVKR
jgi:hypothetical protein